VIRWAREMSSGLPSILEQSCDLSVDYVIRILAFYCLGRGEDEMIACLNVS